MGDEKAILVKDFYCRMFFDLIVIEDIGAIICGANDVDGCFFHDSCGQIVAEAGIANLMRRHVHELRKRIEMDFFTTDDTVLPSPTQ